MAGCSAALALARDPGLRVALLDRAPALARQSGNARVGESLSPACKPVLESLGLLQTLNNQDYRPYHGNKSLWNDELAINDFVSSPLGSGWHLDRSHFDSLLRRECLNQSVTLLDECRLLNAQRLDTSSQGWRVTARTGTTELTLQSRFLIDASGTSSSVARKLGESRSEMDQLFCVYAFIPQQDHEECYSYVEATDEGWWYTTSIPEGRMLIMFTTDSEHLPAYRKLGNFRTALQRTRLISEFVSTLPEELAIKPIQASHLSCFSRNNWLAIGDAAFTLDPILANGLCRALEQGLYSAQTVNRLLASNGDSNPLYRAHNLKISHSLQSNAAVRDHIYSLQPRNTGFWQRRKLSGQPDPSMTA